MADEEEEFGVKFAATAETVTEAKESFQHLTEEMKETAKAGATVATATKTVDDAASELRKQIADLEEVLRKQAVALANNELPLDVFLEGNKAARTVIGQLESALDSITPKLGDAIGEGTDEDGTSGFKGIAGAAVKAEKAIGKLASGHGLNSLPTLLEGIGTAIGLGGGAGLAAGGLILAFESIIPKVETFIEKMTGAAEASERAAKALKEYNEQVEKQRQAFEKLAQEPTREEKAGAADIKALLGEGRARQVKAGIAGGLEAQKFGLTSGEEASLHHSKKMVTAAQQTGEAGGFDVSHWVGEVKRLQDKRSQAIEEEANRWVNELPTNQRVQQAVEGMAAARPGAFPDYTQEMLFAARPENVKQAEIGRQRTKEGEEAGKVQAKAKKEIDESLKFAADWKVELDKQAMNETKAGFKDKVSELKSQLSDLGADLREKTISPQEYKDKADVLVDAIAAAIQGLAKLPGENVKAAHRDIEAAQRTVRSVFAHGVDAVKHATDKALYDAKTAADKAKQAADKFDREHTPEALTSAEAKAQASEIMGAEREQNQYRANMGAIPFDARELEEIKHKALQAMPMYKARGFSVGQLVADMMAMQANQIEQGIYDGLDRHGRSVQNVNPCGGH